MTIRPKQFARIGECHLEKAVLDVLLEAKYKEELGLGPANISRRAGVYRGRTSMRDAITAGILFKLEEKGKVERLRRGVWRLSDKEFNKRRDDIR